MQWHNVATFRFGSDFNGVSDALEGNLAINELLFAYDNTWPTRQAWVSMRGNSLSNCLANSATGRPPLGDGSSSFEGQNTYAQFMDVNGPTISFR